MSEKMNPAGGAPERIGILGGTFNPIHNGHLHLAREFRKRLGLSRVLLIPTKVPPHKEAEELLPGEVRLEMCRLAAKEEPFLDVSDIELRREEKSYTALTLEALSAQMPGARFYFLMGSDMFLTLEKWWNFKRIVELSDLCAAARTEGELAPLRAYSQRLEKRYGARCHIESIPVMELSSTEIREILKGGGSAAALLPGAVERFIRENGLYFGHCGSSANK